eukprot:10321458-Alexandrium_andersonii.AAC.1
MPVGKLGRLVRGRPRDRASFWRVRIPGHPTVVEITRFKRSAPKATQHQWKSGGSGAWASA